MARFIIKLRTNGLYYFQLKLKSGEIVLSSEGYTSKIGCYNGIQSIKLNASNNDRYVRQTSSTGKYYFNLKALNGQIIGTSEMYNSQLSMEEVIDKIKNNVSSATIEDIS